MGKINAFDKIMFKNKKKIVLEWNSPLSKASWRQRKRWHHLPYL